MWNTVLVEILAKDLILALLVTLFSSLKLYVANNPYSLEIMQIII